MNRTLAIYVLGVFLAASGTGWADDHGHGPKGTGHEQPAKHVYKHGKKELKADEEREKHARPAVAPGKPPDVHPLGPPMRFRGLDLDHNGVITRSEWRGSDQSFREHDWNHDGVLSGDEVRPGAVRPTARPAAVVAPRFADFDRNHNGVITRDEWRGDLGVFNRLDRNHDGVLTPAEFSVRWW